MTGLKVFLFFICMSVTMAFPPLALIVLLLFIASEKNGNSISGKVHHSKIAYPPCRAYGHEIDKNGMTQANAYRDKRGVIRYCANPNHTHYYSGLALPPQPTMQRTGPQARIRRKGPQAVIRGTTKTGTENTDMIVKKTAVFSRGGATALKRNKSGKIILKQPKTKTEALQLLKNGYLLNATNTSGYSFKKRDLFEMIRDEITTTPTKYPVNYISFLNGEVSHNEYQCLIPNAGNTKGAIYRYCCDFLEEITTYKKGNQIIISA